MAHVLDDRVGMNQVDAPLIVSVQMPGVPRAPLEVSRIADSLELAFIQVEQSYLRHALDIDVVPVVRAAAHIQDRDIAADLVCSAGNFRRESTTSRLSKSVDHNIFRDRIGD